MKPQNPSNSLHGWLYVVLLATVVLVACAGRSAQAPLSPEDQSVQYKFRGADGGVLYFDGSGYRKEKITMYNEKGEMWRAFFGINSGAQQSSYPAALYLPKTLRVIWRSNDAVAVRRYGGPECGTTGCPDYSRMGFEGGTVLGDYTVPLAVRIPDEVLDYIRANGGALRVKIRLKDNGVAIGWDVEHVIPYKDWKPNKLGLNSGVNYRMAGGDFREAKIYNGKVVDPGWEH